MVTAYRSQMPKRVIAMSKPGGSFWNRVSFLILGVTLSTSSWKRRGSTLMKFLEAPTSSLLSPFMKWWYCPNSSRGKSHVRGTFAPCLTSMLSWSISSKTLFWNILFQGECIDYQLEIHKENVRTFKLFLGGFYIPRYLTNVKFLTRLTFLHHYYT